MKNNTTSFLMLSVTTLIIAITMLGAVVVISIVEYSNVLIVVLTVFGATFLIESYYEYMLYKIYKEIDEKYEELDKIHKETKNEINSHKNSTH